MADVLHKTYAQLQQRSALVNQKTTAEEKRVNQETYLGGEKHTEGQCIEEVACTEQTLHRADRETRRLCEVVRNVLQLGNVVRSVTAVLFEVGNELTILFASIFFTQLHEA